CGHVMKCPHCDVSLSEHAGGRLMCHYCGHTETMPKICPQCGSRYISGFRAGTQQVEERLKALLPGVRTLRMDADTTRTKGSYEKILSAFSNGEADVLIGTQMIVKGHDFPKVTLVGVLAADLSLNMSDYRAGERTFQLLAQAVGRAGRGELAGEAVIQTYQPEHYAVVHAADQNYEGFYGEEIIYREMVGYPPVSNMLAVQVFSRTEEAGFAMAGRLAGEVKERFVKPQEKREDHMLPLQLIGPAPATIGRINDIFRFVFYVKSTKYVKLVQIKDMLEEELRRQPPAGDLTVQFDFNPVNIM
ncbi:MAG TPA: primosomal protein N', partial [Lachnospiraceae bacterium]|nr:primosomal protein N' [Lachnospiraceae bacterium]